MPEDGHKPIAWVTGAAGFIGGHLCAALLQAGWQVIAIDNLSAPHALAGWQRLMQLRSRYPSHDSSHDPVGALTLQRADLLDPVPLEAPRPDCVFHLAAQPGVRSSESLDFYLEANLKSTEALLNTLDSPSVVVFASSSSVYGDSTGHASATENAPCHPRSVYGQSKWHCEKYLAERAAQSGFKAVALRLFSVYGPHQRPDMAFQRWAQAILTHQPLILHDPHQMSRDFTCVNDVIQAFLQAADYGKKMPTAYACFNVGSGVKTPLLTAAKLWIQQLEQAAGHSLNAPIETRAAHRAEVLHTWASLEHSQRLLGYQPRYTLTQGMAEFAHHVLKTPHHLYIYT